MLAKFQFTLAEKLAAQATALQSGQHRDCRPTSLTHLVVQLPVQFPVQFLGL